MVSDMLNVLISSHGNTASASREEILPMWFPLFVFLNPSLFVAYAKGLQAQNNS